MPQKFSLPPNTWETLPESTKQMNIEHNKKVKLNNRKSFMGYSTYLNDAPIFNKSKTQNSVTLSVCEAEMIAAMECAQTMLFV